jgi:hypothetical protein
VTAVAWMKRLGRAHRSGGSVLQRLPARLLDHRGVSVQRSDILSSSICW